MYETESWCTRESTLSSLHNTHLSSLNNTQKPIAHKQTNTKRGDAFDADLKRFRYASSLAYAGLLACEFAAPFAPASFLLLASISNVGRAVRGPGGGGGG